MSTVMSSANSIISSFLVFMLFTCFSCLIVVARTSSTMLNRVVRVGILALFFILGGKHLVFPLSMMLTVQFFW